MQTILKRREFLGQMAWLGPVAALAGAWPAAAFPAAPRRKELPLDQLTLTHFAPHVGGRFVLRQDSGPALELELMQVTALGAKGPRPAHLAVRAPFSLLFRAPKEAASTQCIYHLEHETLGGLDIFLVPIGRDEAGLKFEAIFN